MTAGRLALLLVLGACHSYGADDGTSQSPVRVRCTTDFCPDDKPVCCAAPREAGGGYRDFVCRAEGACADGVTVRCRDSADCASGQTCCLFRTTSAVIKAAECTQPETCVGLNAVLCDRQKPSCDAGQICVTDPQVYSRPLDVCTTP